LAKYKASPPDALQVAASVSFGANAFLTNDKRLAKLEDVIDIIVMDDYIEQIIFWSTRKHWAEGAFLRINLSPSMVSNTDRCRIIRLVRRTLQIQ